MLTAVREVRRHQVDEAQRRARPRCSAPARHGRRPPAVLRVTAVHERRRDRPRDPRVGALDLQEAAAAIDMTANVLGAHPDFKVGGADRRSAPPSAAAHRPGAARLLLVARRAGRTGNRRRGCRPTARRLPAPRRRLAAPGRPGRRRRSPGGPADRRRRLRLDIARRSSTTTTCRSANARRPTAFLRAKFTAQELYDWMVVQLVGRSTSTLPARLRHRAKRAEQAYRFELGVARRQLRPVRLLGQPAQGAAGWGAAGRGPQADGDVVPRALTGGSTS